MANAQTTQGPGAPARKHLFRWYSRYLKDVGSAVSRVWINQLENWDGMLTKMESGNYTAGQWFADVANIWDQSARDLWLAGFPFQRWIQSGDQLPCVAFVVDDVAQAADAKEVRLPVWVDPKTKTVPHGMTTVPPTAAQMRAPSGRPLTNAHIDGAITADGMHLRVGLKGLKDPTGTPLDQGHYRCLLCVEDGNKCVPLAVLEVLKV